MVSKDRKCPKYRASKNHQKNDSVACKKMKPFLKHQKTPYVRHFWPFFWFPWVEKNAFFGAMDCYLREASRTEQSIAPPKRGNDGRIYELSRQLH